MSPSGVPKVFTYKPTTWLDSLGAYNQSTGPDSLMDLSRLIIDSNNYFFMGYPFPQSDVTLIAGPTGVVNCNIPAFGSIQGNISLEPDTYVVSLGVFSLHPEGAGATDNGFKLSIYDKGAKTYLVDRGFIFYRSIGSDGDSLIAPGTVDVPFGPHYFTSPFIVTHPGILQVELTNLNNNPDYIQIMLGCAVPITTSSTNTPVIRGN